MWNILFGWVLGIAGTLLVDLWRRRGSVRVAQMHVWKRGAPDWAEAEQMALVVTLRFENTFPIEKSVSVSRVDYFVDRTTGGSGEMAFSDPLPMIGGSVEMARDQDIPLPANSSTRLHITTATPHVPDSPGVTKRLLSIRWARVELHVLPSRRHVEWLDLRSAIDMEDPVNAALYTAKFPSFAG